MDVAMTIFETKTKIVTLMDAPGHRDFIPNMIQGTAQVSLKPLEWHVERFTYSILPNAKCNSKIELQFFTPFCRNSKNVIKTSIRPSETLYSAFLPVTLPCEGLDRYSKTWLNSLWMSFARPGIWTRN